MYTTSQKYFNIEFLNETEVEIDQLSEPQRARLYHKLNLVRLFGYGLTMPHAAPIRGKIWEFRYTWKNVYYRMFYFSPEKDLFIMLHLITKKTNKTPVREIAKAEHRMKDYQTRNRKQKL